VRKAKVALVVLLALLVPAGADNSSAQSVADPRNQTPLIGDCPTVAVSCVDTAVFGAPLTFTANISGGDPAVTPTYKWTVTDLRILSGRDTHTITVEAPMRGGAFKATVEVGGYDRACTMTASCETNLILEPIPVKAGEYGKYFDDEKAQLSDLYDELRKDPTAQGYLVCYGGRRSRRDEARRRCERGRDYLGRTRGITAGRIVTVDGGFREEPLTELWVVPSGVTPPPASPTVDPSEVRPPAPPRRARRRGRR